MAEARYDSVADFYEAGWSDAYDDPVTTALFDLLGPVENRRVLDLACGHGRITRELARRGARVVGVDISAALIEKAEAAERAQPLGLRYLHADVATTRALDGAGFAAATCGFGLSDIDDLDGAVGTVAAALAAGGTFVFSILHPCFPGRGEVSGSWPSTGRYLDEGWWAAEGTRSTLRRQVGANHRTLSTYVAVLRRHGLWLDAMAEPGPSPDWADADTVRFPVFLVVRCVTRDGAGRSPRAASR